MSITSLPLYLPPCQHSFLGRLLLCGCSLCQSNLLKQEAGSRDVCCFLFVLTFLWFPLTYRCLKDGKGDVAFVKHTTVQGRPANHLFLLSIPTCCFHSILGLVYAVQTFVSLLAYFIPQIFYTLETRFVHCINYRTNLSLLLKNMIVVGSNSPFGFFSEEGKPA